MTHPFPIHRWLLRTLLVAFVLIAAFAVLACTGDDDDEAAAPETTAPAPTAALASTAGRSRTVGGRLSSYLAAVNRGSSSL
ncbi:MAG: hypothetical protein F4Y98_01040 [Chloroflexi bacterium]|nr:hypothetical protein [Chloroflexota bacterium]